MLKHHVIDRFQVLLSSPAQMEKNTYANLTVPALPRFNEIGVQQLSDHVYSQIFPNQARSPDPVLVALSKEHLSRHDLLGKSQDAAEPIAFDMPALQGQTMDEHFFKLGMDASEPYLTYAKSYTTVNSPQKPREWVKRSGWTKYNSDGSWESVNAPNESMLTFDTEVMYKEHSFAVMACAVSPTAWYAWLSPWLLGESENEVQLIPLGDIKQPRIIVGHNIGYDRARVLEEYGMEQTRNFFLDTMSLHVAVNGMCSQQRPTWMRHKKNKDLRDKIANERNSVELAALLESKMLSEEEEELWVGRSSVNSLRDVAKFHCDVTIDKSQRDYFGELNRNQILGKLEELLDYCAADVAITHRVYKKVFPNFLEVCPHPVSFGALRHLSSVILPVNETWKEYITNAEATYHQRVDDVQRRLVELCDEALKVKESPDIYTKDPWLRQLDWSGQEIKMAKGKKKGDPPRPAARQKKPGMPQWYKDLFPSNTADINLTVRTRIAPILLKLSWDGYPLIWSDKFGWTFKVPKDQVKQFENQPVVLCDMSEEKNLELRDDRKHVYFKLPHKDGPQARCVNPLAKGYLQYFERGTLSSQYALAKEALEMNASCSYWISARDRIMSQMVVYEDQVKQSGSTGEKSNRLGFILPQIIPMGTITRRAVENTWLTASNAKANRVGSELKAMIKAPPGYVFVGADVDSQELWIASLVGDAQFQLHGGNAIGFMTLEGSKAAGTDMHSRTAQILGISRNDAKVFNYGRIYGAGVKFAATLLRQFNPSMSEKETQEVATNLYRETKGTRTTRRILSENPFWRGGTESFVFNKLEEFAEQERPRTPALGAGITEALMRRFINKGSFMTSRINWAIQSSGVDYLHLLIVSMDYLIRRFNIDARLAITVHDEIRYLVKKEDKYRAAMALQVANVWTRAMFSQQVGIDDLPQSCAYFSAVDIDHVLRKEVDMDCVTPSHPHKIPHGESLDISRLLDKDQEAYLDPSVVPVSPPSPQKYTYTPRESVMASLQATNNPTFIKAQITKDDKELRELIKEVTKTKSATASSTRSVRNGAKSTNFPSAEPQKAVLMDIDSGLYRDFRYLPQGSRPPHFNMNRQTWKPRPAARP
jgi:DNA polymerase gamma 1